MKSVVEVNNCSRGADRVGLSIDRNIMKQHKGTGRALQNMKGYYAKALSQVSPYNYLVLCTRVTLRCSKDAKWSRL